MAHFNVTLIEKVNMGNMVTGYVAYQLDVESKNQTWSVFRRYAEFEALHSSLKNEYVDGDNLAQLAFPEKNITAQFQTAINETRMVALQRYIEALLKNGFATDPKVEAFFDLKHQGKSGAVQDLGMSKIECESLAQVKPGLQYIEPWSTAFVVLSKQGTLYVMNSKNDSVSKAMVAFPLSAGHIQIQSDASYMDVYISNEVSKQQVSLRFFDQQRYGQWLRILSDMTIRYYDAGMNSQPVAVSSKASAKVIAPGESSRGSLGENVVNVRTDKTTNPDTMNGL
jgi:hypothetical protein